MKRVLLASLFTLIVLQVGLAERGWIPQRLGGASKNLVTFFDSSAVASTEVAASSPFTVGTNPVDIAADSKSDTIPARLFVANQGGNSISVIDYNTLKVANTLTGSSGSLVFNIFGALDTPAAIKRVEWSIGGSASSAIAVIDRKVISGTGGAKGTLRMFNAQDYSVYSETRDTSTTTNYEDLIQNSSRLFITDSGDKGVLVIKTDLFANPLALPSVLIYNGPGEFADFISSPTALQAPQRMANYGTKVIVTDLGSNFVTILKADYPSDASNNNPSSAIIKHIDIGGPSFDVAVLNNKAYVTSHIAGAAAVVVIDLFTNLVLYTRTGASLALGGDFIQAIGVNQAGTVIYIGTRPGGTSSSNVWKMDPTTDLLFAAPNPVVYTNASAPYRFFFTSTTNPSGGGDPAFNFGPGGGSAGNACIVKSIKDDGAPPYWAVIALMLVVGVVRTFWPGRQTEC